LRRYDLLLFALLLLILNANLHSQTVRDVLSNARQLVYASGARRVNQTVAENIRQDLAPKAQIIIAEKVSTKPQSGVVYIAIADEGFIDGPQNPPDNQEWMYFRLDENGSGEILASKPNLLYALFCRIREDWANADIEQFENGRLTRTSFSLLTGRDDLLTGRMGFLRQRKQLIQITDVERAMQELARLGCSHVVVNELATPYGYETGPEGEIYYRFYDYLPDFDQFVETKLNKDTYPREYLESNLNSLKLQAQLADKYGLTPGMHIANPRSVPESLLQRYPFLRGARVDHTFRSFRPRYTLTLAHPAVRWHYAELLRNLLRLLTST